MKYLFSKKYWNQKQTEKKLEKYQEPDPSFFILMSFSSLIAALGLILDSVAVVIGAMMIAPIITPVFGFSLNFLTFQIKDSLKNLGIILLGTLAGLASAVIMGGIVEFISADSLKITEEIISRIKPNLLHLLVAIFSGMVGAYAYSTQGLSERIVGIAISVALIPPLAVVALGIVINDPQIWQGSILLYLTNLAGIIFGSVFMFILLGFGEFAEEGLE